MFPKIADFFYRSLYRFVITPTLFVILGILSLFRSKARRTTVIHFKAALNWKSWIQSLQTKSQPYYWFHVSSVGEYLQALPVIQALKNEDPETGVLLTYFSPSLEPYWAARRSSFEELKIDGLSVLPWDLECFHDFAFRSLKIKAVIFTKFDLWPVLIWTSRKHKIPTYWISATLREKSSRFWARGFFKNLFECFEGIFCVSQRDQRQILKFLSRDPSPLRHERLSVLGDTRVDSVWDQIQKKSPALTQEFSDLTSLKRDRTFVMGSLWPQDLILLDKFWNLDQIDSVFDTFIIVPHEISPQSIKVFEHVITQKWKFTQIKENLENGLRTFQRNKRTLYLWPRLGLLSRLYAYSKLTFVGTGPGGVHNTMEPAAWGSPVICGPHYHNAPEFFDFLDRQAALSVNSANEFYTVMKDLLAQPERIDMMGQKAKLYMEEARGSAQKCAIKISNGHI